MAKLSKFDEARIGGMQYALKIAEEKGVDGLRDEVRFRCDYKIPIGLPQSKLDEFSQNVKHQMYDTMKVVASMALCDSFGFGAKRLKEFWGKFEDLCEAKIKDYVTFQDFIDTMNAEKKVDIPQIGENNKNVKVEMD